jgi:hypothetical protein
MKRIFKSAFLATFFLAVPSLLVMGQDKKSEQKVKIIVNDGSGNKVVMDTIFKDTPAPDSIIVSDGTVIYMKHGGEGKGFKHHGKEHFNVTYSDNGKGEGKEFKDMTIITTDSLTMSDSGDSNKVFFYTDSDHRNRGERGNARYRVITRDTNAEGDKDEVVYINKNKSSDTLEGKHFNVYVTDSDNDSGAEKSRFVIAKDGMVVTIEGNDEAKVKELANEIRDKLGVSSEDNAKKEQNKSVSTTKTKK